MQLQFYPKLIEFLGYFPFEIDTAVLGGKIKEYRYTNGLSYKELGKLVSVDPTTIRGWELGRNILSEKTRKVIMDLLNQKM